MPEVGDVRLFSIFRGDINSRSIGLFAVNRDTLAGEIFSAFAASETFALKGELGGPSLSLSDVIEVCVVKLVTS